MTLHIYILVSTASFLINKVEKSSENSIIAGGIVEKEGMPKTYRILESSQQKLSTYCVPNTKKCVTSGRG